MQRRVLTWLMTLLTASSASLSADPIAYSINSDSGSDFHDSLYRIDLATGQEIQRVGKLRLLPSQTTPLDVEGLAFAPDGTLYGLDDETLTLFPLNKDNASFNSDELVEINGLTPGSNDFGMTFACDGELYITSVARQSLYRVDLNGDVTPVGTNGSLGVDITALAAYGNPVRLYGLGTGGGGESAPYPNLYEIDANDGTATLIGPLGPNASTYTEGGLAFDDSGQLWAITDRRALLSPSQVMRLNTSTGNASDVRNTTEQGFESLAISSPGGCARAGDGESARFVVQKRFADGNDITPVELSISCNTGLPLSQSLIVKPKPGDGGNVEVTFVVTEFTDQTLSCNVSEKTLAGYTAEYDCQSDSGCSTANGSGPCTFTDVHNGQESRCLIHNHVDPVEVVVTKEWLYPREEVDIDDNAHVALYCSHVHNGDGEPEEGDNMRWFWLLDGNPASATAMVYPAFDGKTECWTEEYALSSAVESENTCAEPLNIRLGDGQRHCSIINTVFFEGIPTLSLNGLVLFAGLMLLTGLMAARRF